MEYVHVCSFCGWRRGAASAVMLPPGCARCGCPLDSMTSDEHARRARDTSTADAASAGGDSRALRVAAALFALAFACAAARVGYVRGGAWGAIVALGVAGYLLLPFVPDRVGSAGRATRAS